MTAVATDTAAPLPKANIRPGAIIAWTLLFIGGLIMVSPLLFMFSTSLKTAGQVYDLRLIPAEPGLLELFLTLPVMDAGRARRELDWVPRHASTEALGELLDGLRHPDGAPTRPLAGTLV